MRLMVSAVIAAATLIGCATPQYTNTALKKDPTKEYLKRNDVPIIRQLVADIEPSAATGAVLTGMQLYEFGNEPKPGNLPTNVQNTVHEVANKLVSANPFIGLPPKLYFDDCLNRYAEFVAPNKLVLCKGLISQSDTYDEIAFALAHEMAHSYLNHTITDVNEGSLLLGIVSNVLMETAVEFAASKAQSELEDLNIGGHVLDKDEVETWSEIGGKLGLVPVAYLSAKAQQGYYHPKGLFHQEQELIADALAIDLMFNAGFDPQAAVFFIAGTTDAESDVHPAKGFSEFTNNFVPATLQKYPELDKRYSFSSNYLNSHYSLDGRMPNMLPWDSDPDFALFDRSLVAAKMSLDLAQKASKAKGNDADETQVKHFCEAGKNLIRDANKGLVNDRDLARREVALWTQCSSHFFPTLMPDLFKQGRLEFNDLNLLGSVYMASGNTNEAAVIAKAYSENPILYKPLRSDVSTVEKMRFFMKLNAGSFAREIKANCLARAKSEYDRNRENDNEIKDSEDKAKARKDTQEDYTKDKNRCNSAYNSAYAPIGEADSLKKYSTNFIFSHPLVQAIMQ